MPAHPVARLADLAPGTMTAAKAGDTEVLLCNVGGEVSALHPKCTHYGAPLADGVLNGHRLVCPWHHACFDARTGRHLEAPGCDALVRYRTEVRDGEVWVVLPQGEEAEREAQDGQIPNPMVRGGQTADRPYVVVGGGPAGQHAVEGLRQGGYQGPITLVTAESRLPYDRTQVSKGLLTGDRPAEKMPLRPRSFYDRHRVEVLTGKRVERIDARAHTLHFAGGGTLAYAKACVATGSTPRRLDVPGAQLPGVYSLRDYEDAEAVRLAAGEGKRAVVIGASFIGMEAAMALAKLGCAVTVVSPEEVPFGKTFGERVGRVIKGWQEGLGVKFRGGENVTGFEGVRKVTGVRLESGDTLRAAFVVVGIGVTPNSDLVDGVAPGDDGGISTDDQLYAGHDIWVAGDIASAPQNLDGSRARIEHWRVAEQQGTVAGNAMAGAPRTLLSVPYFWTNQAGHNLRYAGHHARPDQIVFDGRPEEGSFIAYYIEGDRVAAALGYKRDRDLAAIHELMWLGAMPSAARLDPAAAWTERLAAANA